MLQEFSNIQLNIDSYIAAFDSVIFFINTFIKTNINYYGNYVLSNLNILNLYSNLVYSWFNPFNLSTFYNYSICDQNIINWLFNNNTYNISFWMPYNVYFQYQWAIMDSLFINLVEVKWNSMVFYLNPYYILIIINFIKYSFFFIFFLNLFFFLRTNVKRQGWINNLIFSKFFLFFETEEELGSIDDALSFIMLFFLLFSWFFLLSIFLFKSYLTSMSVLSIGFCILVLFVLLIPFGVLLDFGIAFASYIRGAGSGTNVIVEILFDLIGTLVVFTRFIVQNIRFVLIFWAYFELFEWIYNSPYLYLFNNIFSFNWNSVFLNQQLTVFNFFYYINLFLGGFIGYLYYFLHLLILLFIQLGAYFLISFWLFFFFYTSFYLTKSEKYFFFKRYL